MGYHGKPLEIHPVKVEKHLKLLVYIYKILCKHNTNIKMTCACCCDIIMRSSVMVKHCVEVRHHKISFQGSLILLSPKVSEERPWLGLVTC